MAKAIGGRVEVVGCGGQSRGKMVGGRWEEMRHGSGGAATVRWWSWAKKCQGSHCTAATVGTYCGWRPRALNRCKPLGPTHGLNGLRAFDGLQCPFEEKKWVGKFPPKQLPWFFIFKINIKLSWLYDG